MAIDGITWLQDGERANASVLNRPMKQIVEKVNQELAGLGGGGGGTGSGFPQSIGFTVSDDKVGPRIETGKVVYFKGDDQTIQLASKNTKVESQFVGIYREFNANTGKEHHVITYGLASVPTKLQAEIGTTYYLAEDGDLTKDYTPGAIPVGKCVKANTIMVTSSFQEETKPDIRYAQVAIEQGKTEYNINYIPGRTLFYVEGILVSPNDITATSGTSVTLKFAAKKGDILSAVVL